MQKGFQTKLHSCTLNQLLGLRYQKSIKKIKSIKTQIGCIGINLLKQFNIYKGGGGTLKETLM